MRKDGIHIYATRTQKKLGFCLCASKAEKGPFPIFHFQRRTVRVSSPPPCRAAPSRGQQTEMENAVLLREWFDRVDADRTGNITAPQLQVCFPRLRSRSPSRLLQERTANARTRCAPTTRARLPWVTSTSPSPSCSR
jgi:hypothetical protein